MKPTSLTSDMVTDLACVRLPPGTPVSRIPNGEFFTEKRPEGESEGHLGMGNRMPLSEHRGIKKRGNEGGEAVYSI